MNTPSAMARDAPRIQARPTWYLGTKFGIWRCPRGCRNGGENKFWNLPGGGFYRSGQSLLFSRAPRAERRAA